MFTFVRILLVPGLSSPEFTTYIPMRHGFMYLTAIIDVYSRKIVGWGVSNSLTAQWCKNVLEDAIAQPIIKPRKMAYIFSFLIVIAVVVIFRALSIWRATEASSGQTLKTGNWYQCRDFVRGFNAAGEANGNNHRAMIAIR